MKDRVTAVIVSWSGNTPRFLEESVQSWRDQGIEPVVLNDDRPTDEKWNEALDSCTTEYLFLPHDDDVYHDNFVSEMVAYMDAHPAAAACFCMDRFIDKDGTRTLDQGRNPATRLPIPPQEYYYFKEIFEGIAKHGNFLRCETVMLRTSLINQSRLRYPSKDECGTAHDLQFWYQILDQHPIAILDKELVSYRIHDRQDTASQRNATGAVDHYKAMYYGLNLRRHEISWDVKSATERGYEENCAREEVERLERRSKLGGPVEFYVVHEAPDNAGTGVLVADRVRRRNREDSDRMAFYVIPILPGSGPEGVSVMRGVPVLHIFPSSFQRVVDQYKPVLISYQHLLRWPLGILGVGTDAERELYLHDAYLWCTVRWHGFDGKNICHDPTPEKCSKCMPGAPPPEAHRQWTEDVRSYLKGIDRIVANSPDTAEHFERNYGIAPEVETPVPPPLPLYRKRKVFGYFGGFYPVKGVDVLLDAWDRVLWGQLLMFCDVPEGYLKGRSMYGYPNVLVMGRYEREDLPKLLNLVDCVIVPSRNESFGMVKRECEALGKKVIATRVGGLDGTIEPGNVEELLYAIQGEIGEEPFK